MKKPASIWRIVLIIVLLLVVRAAFGQEVRQIRGSFCDSQKAIETLVRDQTDVAHKCGNMVGLSDAATKVHVILVKGVWWDIIKVHLIAHAIGGRATGDDSIKFIAMKTQGEDS